MKKTSFLALGILLLTSCLEQEPVPNAEARNRVQAFAEAYFNYDFQRAAELVTPESMKWLRFAASNITQQDIDMLNAQETPTVVDVTDYWQAPGDSMGTATVEVTDYLQKKAIEGGMQLVEEATFQLTVVEREGVYYVRMEGLLRSGTQSRGSAGDE